ncbi:MAG: hypothetical protein WBP59_06105 [Ilumatobacteraceae bacterium]
MSGEERETTVEMLARWTGRWLCITGLAAWSLWLGWRVSSPLHGIVGVSVLVLELAALSVAAVITIALWPAPRRDAVTAAVAGTRLPERLAATFGFDEVRPMGRHGDDDTGEVAIARHGLLGLQGLDIRRLDGATRPTWSSTAWNLVAVEGMRRMLCVVALVVVLLTGRVPFDVPPWPIIAALAVALASLSAGHWLLSGGSIRPGARLHWSMASVGAGLGDGRSRTGLPIRWATTMATIVVLNLAVSLRGFSDRWTHGLGAMPHDQRVLAMSMSWGLVLVGFVSLRSLERPALGFYGATRRLEETSTRRLALGATLAVAAVGYVAGVLPGSVPA